MGEGAWKSRDVSGKESVMGKIEKLLTATKGDEEYIGNMSDLAELIGCSIGTLYHKIGQKEGTVLVKGWTIRWDGDYIPTKKQKEEFADEWNEVCRRLRR